MLDRPDAGGGAPRDGGGFRGGGFQSRAMARPSINARPAARPSPRRADVRRDYGRADVSRRVDRRTDINRDIRSHDLTPGEVARRASELRDALKHAGMEVWLAWD